MGQLKHLLKKLKSCHKTIVPAKGTGPKETLAMAG
jgi:hypothetical protein